MDRFKILTLVDVTETNARRGEDRLLVNQQANFMTLYQVIGLRSNPTDFKIKKFNEHTDVFGSNYKNIKCYWQVEFTIESTGSITTNMLESDFDLVPFITELEECVNFKETVFYTTDKRKKNIIFYEDDK